MCDASLSKSEYERAALAYSGIEADLPIEPAEAPSEQLCALSNNVAALPIEILTHTMADSSPWAFGWAAIAGIFTAILAIATGWLAWSTRALARETDQDVRASWRPILAVEGQQRVHVTVSLTQENGVYAIETRFTLTNVGRGPALNCELLELKSRSAGGPRRAAESLGNIAVGAPYELRVYANGLAAEATDWMNPTRYDFRIRYQDIGRNLHETVLVFQGLNEAEDGASGSLVPLQETELYALEERVAMKGWPR